MSGEQALLLTLRMAHDGVPIGHAVTLALRAKRLADNRKNKRKPIKRAA